MNAAVLAGLLAAGLADAELWEAEVLPSEAVCVRNYQEAAAAECRYQRMMAMSPCRTRIIEPALRDAEWRRDWWQAAVRMRGYWRYPRVDGDFRFGPDCLRRLKEAVGPDDWAARRWPAPTLFGDQE